MSTPSTPESPGTATTGPSRRGLIIGVVVAVIVVVVGVVLGVTQPWKSDDASTDAQSFDLDQNVRVTFEVPDGWRAASDRLDDAETVFVLPASDSRTPAEIQRDLGALKSGTSADDIHLTMVKAGECPAALSSLAVGEWKVKESTSADDQGLHGVRNGAAYRVDGDVCVQFAGVDVGATTPTSSQGTELTTRLGNDSTVTVERR